LRGTDFGAAAAGGLGLAGTACARTGDPAIPASAASMINDLARLVIGAINPFISKDNPPFQIHTLAFAGSPVTLRPQWLGFSIRLSQTNP
jgi:hypothetical protein